MKIKILLVSLLLFILFPNLAYASCNTGNPWSVAYIRRNNNRCEGILDRNISTSSFPDLISFATSNLTEYPNDLLIQVPVSSKELKVSIQSFTKRYRLDELKLEDNQSNLTFKLNTRKVLQHRRVQIPFDSLRSLAFMIEDSEPLYFPVVLGKNSDEYEFVINAVRRTAFPVLEIRHEGETIFKFEERNNPQRGHIRLLWNYKNAVEGNYELYLETSEGKTRSFPFQHNPDWFKN